MNARIYAGECSNTFFIVECNEITSCNHICRNCFDTFVIRTFFILKCDIRMYVQVYVGICKCLDK